MSLSFEYRCANGWYRQGATLSQLTRLGSLPKERAMASSIVHLAILTQCATSASASGRLKNSLRSRSSSCSFCFNRTSSLITFGERDNRYCLYRSVSFDG